MKLKRRYNIQIQKAGAEGGCANQDHWPASDLERWKDADSRIRIALFLTV
jgi:hypothetical protein